MVFFNLFLLVSVGVGPHHVDAHLPELFPDFVFFSGGWDPVMGGADGWSAESLFDSIRQPVVKDVLIPFKES
jgi:hypothetical protein|tara:strand:- start:250 stop:465 length:216 start_codon:yes stop_codon:yes gene_type:complete